MYRISGLSYFRYPAGYQIRLPAYQIGTDEEPDIRPSLFPPDIKCSIRPTGYIRPNKLFIATSYDNTECTYFCYPTKIKIRPTGYVRPAKPFLATIYDNKECTGYLAFLFSLIRLDIKYSISGLSDI